MSNTRKGSDPKESKNTAAYWKQAFKELEEAHNNLYLSYIKVQQANQEWVDEADKAHKEVESIARDVTSLIEQTIKNLVAVGHNTEEISNEDVIYHLNLMDRSIQSKYNPEIPW
jgi:archaellum component FlaF (FlaF/FlaG flagellin family)